jgi:prolyl oligopeptidase
MLFFKALFALLAYDIQTAFRPFKVLHSTVRSWKVANRPIARDSIDRVCKAVNYACVWYPKQALCLQRSFVTTYLLRKSGLQAQMVLGARKLPFKAHAWVEVNGRAVNERSDVQATYGVWERC